MSPPFKNPKKVSIISSVYGNKDVVEKCVNSWLPIPEQWSLTLYNNNKSYKDGTSEVIFDARRKYNFNIIDEKIDIYHADALDKMILSTDSEWILMLDSDAYLKDSKFYEWVNLVINDTGVCFWGTSRFYKPVAHVGWYPPLPTCLIPRADSWIMLVNRSFIKKYSLIPHPIRVDGTVKFGKMTGNDSTIEYKKDDDAPIRIAGDVGWQYYSVALQLSCFKQLPSEMLDCWHHVQGASVDPTKKFVLR